ncbi:MAG: diaminopimelate decarboxylase [Sedimentisphaerales bacterium]|jgi:diaminopimelate decarboxylase
MLSHTKTKKIEAEFGSPFYIFDETAFRENYDDIVSAFGKRYEKFILAYSYKTNYLPYLCGIIKSKGGFAEVVSRLEYDLALKVGQKPDKIVFNGPVKRYEDIELALKNNSIVNLDSWSEIDLLAKYAKKNPNRKIKVGLRINIGLSDKSGRSHIQEHLKTGRFGFDPSDSNMKKVVSRLSRIGNVTVNSLHGHTSTTNRSVWCYQIIAETLCRIAENFFSESVEYINVGGGIFGYIPPQMRWAKTPSFDDYAKAVCKVLKTNKWVRRQKPRLMLEPGIAMVANALSFITKVISIKDIRGRVFVTVDGSAYNVKPTFHKNNNPYQIIKKKVIAQRCTFSVVGSTCMEKDYILTEITDVLPGVGDFIKIDNVGAYTIVLTPPFINPAPAIVVRKSDTFKLVRSKQTLNDMFKNYAF